MFECPVTSAREVKLEHSLRHSLWFLVIVWDVMNIFKDPETFVGLK